MESPTTLHMATFGSGCFWCSEPIFNDLRGVASVIVGYAGGTAPHPTYEDVCRGTTGHAEVIQVTFDPSVISYTQLLDVFFLTHNPTILNRQGNDIGSEYRSVILYHDDQQRQQAEQARTAIDAQHIYSDAIVTTIEPYTSFYPAEEYHQHYYEKNPDQGYCQVIIDPKVAKFRQKFAAWRK